MSTAAALLVRLLYRLFYEESETGSQIDRSFLLLSPAITTLFITIQFSLPLSLGLLGALSIVRFRVPIREPEEIGFLMVVIASAIACATYSYLVLALLLALVVVALLLQHLLGRRIPALRRSGGLLMLTIADAVVRAARPAIEAILAARLGWIRLEHLNGRDGADDAELHVPRARGHRLERDPAATLEALGPPRRPVRPPRASGRRVDRAGARRSVCRTGPPPRGLR